ncbi:BTAD domain-containing putative transcriptional regulator [Streptomonospora alba]|uniref:BTAD domain-containing putative transcriptional regulator n=1 Tax=Streptomonospora alba TaxID=183763 RepID=UPI0014705D90
MTEFKALGNFEVVNGGRTSTPTARSRVGYSSCCCCTRTRPDTRRLIDALDFAGRHSEALQANQDVCFILNDELGLDSGPELHRARHRLLKTDPPRTGDLRVTAAQ